MLTIVTLPPCYDLFTFRALEAIENADTVIVQTKKSGAYNGICKSAKEIFTLDPFFEDAESFDALYAAGAKFVADSAKNKNVVFCVLECVSNNGFIQKIDGIMPYKSIYGGDTVSYAVHEASLLLSTIGSYRTLDCRMFEHAVIDTSIALVITGIENKWVLSDTKLALLEYYSADQNIMLLQGCRAEAMILDGIDKIRDFGDGVVLVLPPVPLTQKERWGFYDLAHIMRVLRGKHGCPWDREQTHKTLRPYLIEEAYEVMDAIDSDDTDALYDELGDVLLQAVFHAEIARDCREFELADITTSICRKLIQRHPHVFAQTAADTPEEVITNWEAIKRGEKGLTTVTEALRDAPKTMGALLRALKIQKKAAAAGFDWEDERGAYEKVLEEAAEFRAETKNGAFDKLEDEGGDLLFAAVNLLRKKKINPEVALSRACEKFIRRFGYIEEKSGAEFKNLSLSDMDLLWEEAKKQE